ncbi:hypothetical protein MKX03_029428 [Papaver bracteatum]|nr:hypothetical protein MKX03_029428 [Papaver bracteatum]
MECPSLLTTTSNPNILKNSFLTNRTTLSYKQKSRRRSSSDVAIPSHNRFQQDSSIIQTNSTQLFMDSTKCCQDYETHLESASIFHHTRRFGWLRCLICKSRLVYQSLLVFLFCFTLVGAEASADSVFEYACEDVSSYYSPVENLEGEELMKKLSLIVSNHRALPYKKVWDALKVLDAADVDNPDSSANVTEIYSLKAVPKLLAGKPEGWNREHLWPRSYGLTYGPSLSDLHNIRPADANVNSSRGNKYYGECLPTSLDCHKPANKEAASDTETDKNRWAPPFQVRGDIARALMYMAVSYGYNQTDGSPNLHLSDSPSIKKKEMGLLLTLLKWNELDPPSREEQLRNHRVCSFYQHNRNPFVDHPEYANLIWKQGTEHYHKDNHSVDAWINEFHYNSKEKDNNEFVEIVVGPSTNASELNVTLYNGANGKMYRFLPLVDDTKFTVTRDRSGFLIYTAWLELQNGPGDGIALISAGKKQQVVQFISYSGIIKATDGPAIGLESIDIGLQETDESSEFDSLGVIEKQGDKLEWRKFINKASPRKLNMSQVLSNS